MLTFISPAFLFVILIPALLVLTGVFLDEALRLEGFMVQSLILRVVVSVPLLIVGGYLSVSSNIYLWRVGKGFAWGDAVTSDETRVLVTKGPYSYTRNPMVLGYTMFISSVGILVGSLSAALIIPLVMLVLESVWIKFVEEPRLEKRFGEVYLNYKRRVPFLIPKLSIRRRKYEPSP